MDKFLRNIKTQIEEIKKSSPRDRWRTNVINAREKVKKQADCDVYIPQMVQEVMRVMDEKTSEGYESYYFGYYNTKSVLQDDKQLMMWAFSLRDYPEAFFNYIHQDPTVLEAALMKETQMYVDVKKKRVNVYKTDKATPLEKNVPGLEWRISVA